MHISIFTCIISYVIPLFDNEVINVQRSQEALFLLIRNSLCLWWKTYMYSNFGICWIDIDYVGEYCSIGLIPAGMIDPLTNPHTRAYYISDILSCNIYISYIPIYV